MLWDAGTLFVGFKDRNGNPTVVVQYDDPVPLEVWLDFLQAPSKGIWVHEHIIAENWDYKIVG